MSGIINTKDVSCGDGIPLKKLTAAPLSELEVKRANRECCDTECKVCMAAPVNILTLPCLHFCMCEQCYKEHKQTKNECIICTKTIKRIIKVNSPPDNNSREKLENSAAPAPSKKPQTDAKKETELREVEPPPKPSQDEGTKDNKESETSATTSETGGKRMSNQKLKLQKLRQKRAAFLTNEMQERPQTQNNTQIKEKASTLPVLEDHSQDTHTAKVEQKQEDVKTPSTNDTAATNVEHTETIPRLELAQKRENDLTETTRTGGTNGPTDQRPEHELSQTACCSKQEEEEKKDDVPVPAVRDPEITVRDPPNSMSLLNRSTIASLFDN